MFTVEILNTFLALGTIALQASTLFLLTALFSQRVRACIERSIRKYALMLVFLVSLLGSVLTLVYSEVLGFLPCGLCWFQRIFLYPLVFLSGLALVKRDQNIRDYLLLLSIPGALIALYHHYLQMGGSALVRCPAIAESIDCSKRIVFEFGYITFPLMSFSAFAFIAVLMTLLSKCAKNPSRLNRENGA